MLDRAVVLTCVCLVQLTSAAVGQVFDWERHRLLPSDGISGVASGDFDGDGDLDLVTASTQLIAWNDGEGRFHAGSQAGYPWESAIAVGDIDGDGDLDIAIGYRAFLSFLQPVLLRNDGPAGFTNIGSPNWVTPEGSPSEIVFTDYDGDGDLDMVTAEFSPTIGSQSGQPQPINRLYLNDGSGFFTDVTAAQMPNQPTRNTGVAVGDIDGDGDLDIVFSRGYSNSSFPGRVSVFVQNAAGVALETAGPTLPSYYGFNDVVLSDHDLDGDLDLAAASDTDLLLFANNGAGVFTLSNTIAELNVVTLQSVDLDDDGRMDLLGLRYDPSELAWLPMRHWQNLPSGFVDSTSTSIEDPELSPSAVHVFDCDGDGDDDMWGNTVPQSTLWHNDGQGHLLQLALHDLSGNGGIFSAIDYAVMADADADGDLDAVIVDVSWQGASASFVVNNGNGPGPTRTALLAPDPTREARCAEFVDVDLDGDLDIYVGVQGSGGSGQNPQDLLFHNVAGVFVEAPPTHMPIDSRDTNAIVIGDIDGDGSPDVVVSNDGIGGRVYLGDGLGGFTDASSLLPVLAQSVTSSALFDYDLDGDLDIVQAIGAGPNSPMGLRLLRNEWPLPFVDVTGSLLPPLVARSVATMDIDRDGRTDLLVGDVASGLRVFRSVATGFVDETAIRIAGGSAGSYSFYTVVDADGDGWMDLFGYHSNSTIEYRNANGVLTPFPSGTFLLYGSLPRRPALADFDRDGDIDLIADYGNSRNRIRDLQNAVPPRLGLHGELVLHAHAGDGTNAQLGLLLFSPVRLNTPVSVPGLGLLHLDPSSIMTHSWSAIAATGGEAAVPYLVPMQPVLLGTSLFVQALFVHQPDPATWRLSNFVELRMRT